MQAAVALVCAAALFFLWRATRRRYDGTGYWVADFSLLVVGGLLVFLRGAIPDVFSMVLANMLNVGAAMLMRPGLAAFSGTRAGLGADLAVFAAYSFVLYYFAVVVPYLPWRTAAINLFVIYICARTILDISRKLPERYREYARPIAYALSIFIAIGVVRLAGLAFIEPGTDFLKTTSFEALLLIGYSVGLVVLALAVFMMITRRLMADREKELAEKIRAEAEKQESEERFRRVFRAAPLLMSLSEIESGRYIEVNDKFCETSGFSREEIIGKTSVELGWITAEVRARLLEAAGAGNSLRIPELELCARDGRKVLCSYVCERVRLGEQDIILAIAEDITGQRRAEAAMQSAQRLESLGTLAGGIAHDFNNMLTGITANLSLMRKRRAEGGDLSELLAEAESACLSARNLARQLLTFASGGKPCKARVDLAELLREAVSFSLRGSGVKETMALPRESLVACADRDQLFQVVQNVCLNAVQAMAGRGTFTVTLSESAPPAGAGLPPGRYALLRFEDTGVGIPAKIFGRIFEPYFSTKGGGRGMGLAASRSILRNHCGEILAEPGRASGALFTIALPLAEAEAARQERPAPEARSGKGKRILVLEDEAIVYKALNRMLGELGCETALVSDGGEVVKAWSEATKSGRPFSAAIMDLTIPGGIGGEEAVKLLKEHDSGAKVLASSGYSEVPVMSEFRRYGFDGALPKPYNYDELCSVIKEFF